MKRISNGNFEFVKLSWQDDFCYDSLKDMNLDFKPVMIPHDWLISNVDDLYEDGIGIYRKTFELRDLDAKHYEIYFDGVYMDSSVYLNGMLLGDWKYGYSSFHFSMDEAGVEGENELIVIVRHKSPNTRWYSGAGIFRNVYLCTSAKAYMEMDSQYITFEKTESADVFDVLAEVTIEGNLSGYEEVTLTAQLFDEEGEFVAGASTDLSRPGRVLLKMPNLKLNTWSLDEPYLYSVRLTLSSECEVLDRYMTLTGARVIDFKPESGFYLNGERVELKGVCLHHDQGCLGSAFNTEAMRRQIAIMKEMGANAIRTTHNMPDPMLLRLCDVMGMLVIDEAFDMWEMPKTTYDYARFFKEWHEKDVKSWVNRDANHPCIIMWSIGNEIPDTHASDHGREITIDLKNLVEKYDYRGHARVTIGSNYMPWEGAQRCADEIKLAGYNYGELYYDKHHSEHKDWIIYGSETESIVMSRGIYHFPYRQSILSHDDEQCSSLGNSCTSWGAKSIESIIIHERDRKYSCGQFIWSGFDYIGEPTPYHTKNSYFGQVDTAGFPKDAYYQWQAAWVEPSERIVLHGFPYWSYNEGQLIDLRAATNAPKVELKVNGKSQGVQNIERDTGSKLTGDWCVPYEKGEIEFIAYDENNHILASEKHHSFGEAASLSVEENAIHEHIAGVRDIIWLEIGAKDKDGYPVENANNLVEVKVKGNAFIAGLDSGDSTDYSPYKGDKKRLFAGKLLVAVMIGDEPSDIEVELTSEGLKSAAYKLTVTEKIDRADEYGRTEAQPLVSYGKDESLWPREITLSSEDGYEISEEKPDIMVKASVTPADSASDDEYVWEALTTAGFTHPFVKVEALGDCARYSAIGDCEFRIRCIIKCKDGGKRVFSEIEAKASGMGEAFVDPYGFVVGAMYSRGIGELGNGNEHGVASGREATSVITYDNVDFGEFGSNVLHLPIFALSSDEYPIEIYEGMPGEAGAVLIDKIVYQKPSIWNTYQEEVYTLSQRFKGVKTISFAFHAKVHMKGFYFEKLSKAYGVLLGSDADKVYGDRFEKSGDAILDIGNNVTIEYNGMDFGTDGASKVRFLGRTNNELQTIHINIVTAEGSTRQIVEFKGTAEPHEMMFELTPITGTVDIHLIFLPGTHFELYEVQFIR